MGKKIDLTGKTFSRLMVLGESSVDSGGNIIWECLCSCGTVKGINSRSLRNGSTVSCGCYHREMVSNLNASHRKYGHPVYRAYFKMKTRCYNPKQHGYERYGGRGITVCSRWLNSFENFYEDMGESFQKGMELDRIDNDGNYEPSNCRWTTRQQNNFNKGANTESTSKFKGVCWDKSRSKWMVQIAKDGKRIYSARFEDEVEAALAYNKVAKEYFGEFAYLNKVDRHEH